MISAALSVTFTCMYVKYRKNCSIWEISLTKERFSFLYQQTNKQKRICTVIPNHSVIMTPFGGALLYEAVWKNDLKKAKQLLHVRKVDPNKMPKMLVHACVHDYLEMVELLITNPYNPANVNIDTEYETTNCGKIITRPIWVAIETKNLKLLQLLLQKAKVDLKCTYSYPGDNGNLQATITPFCRAVELKQTAMLHELLKAGANINCQRIIRYRNGKTKTFTQLIHCAYTNSVDMCHFLVRNGCDISARSTPPGNSVTALDFAVCFDHPEIAEFLLQNISRDVSILGTAMWNAIAKRDPKYVVMLIQYGYKLQEHWKPLPEQSTCTDELLCGIKHSAEDLCVTLLQYGCKVNTSGNHFSLAVKQGLIGLTYNIVQLNPQVLQQSWLNDCNDYGNLPSKVINWLQNIRKQPSTLKDLCKAKMLQNLGSLASAQSSQPHIPTLISQLPLPTLLKKFLQFTSTVEAHGDIGI